jgi:peptidoglycan-N-acetylglucosamine deacetylase
MPSLINKIKNSTKIRVNKFSKKNAFIKNLQNQYLSTIVSVETNEKLAALTFDGGPDPYWTPKVLDLLEKYNAKATFFTIGKHVEEHPDIVKKTFDANHTIANHSWDHPCFPLVSRRERLWQIRRCGKSLAEYNSKLFRPPFGHQDMASRFDAFLCGYDVVCWDTHALDWLDTNSDVMVKELNEGLHPGSIILLHDVICVKRDRTREHMLEALDVFLRDNPDYQFLTLPELLERGKRNEMIWLRRPNDEQKRKYGVL